MSVNILQNHQLDHTGFTLCKYSKRLLDKVEYLNSLHAHKVDIGEIQKAIYYACTHHGEQKRQSGEPYYSHPIEVAYLISDYLFRTDILVTSILHDTIEDTDLTKANIEVAFGSQIASQVYDLTRIRDGIKIPSSELVASLWKQKKYDMLLIKQFDRLHNMFTIGAKTFDRIKSITEETIGTFLILAAHLGTREIENKLTQLCINLTKNTKLVEEKDLLFNSDDELLSLLIGNN
jgi:(p)ppGpp synthase/HD superfamily hydrolase